ncbi:hypothetical protein NHG32_02010 [Aerococcaceae bacterium NML191219]|nr:hypothetical protein [Aerococcaceae bacterium NML191219]
MSALCSVALAGLFTTQVSACNNEAHEVSDIDEVYHNKTMDYLNEFG